MLKRVLIGTALAVIALGTLAVPAQARDTTWGCPGCVTTHR